MKSIQPLRSSLLLSVFSGFLITVSNTQVHAQKKKDPLLEMIKEEMNLKGIPGLAFAVLKDNKILRTGTLGYANLDHMVPVTNKTVFPIASIDKQLIATCILRQQEQGKLSIDNLIINYLDSTPISWKNIRIRHLLNHSSGLPDDPLPHLPDKGYDRYSTEDIYNHIIQQETIYPTGERFLYSDAGYFLLQKIFEKATNYYYPDYIRDSIFHVLKMKNTIILDPTEIVPNRSVSYYRNATGKLLINNLRQISMGSYFSDIGTTIDDFIKYDQSINLLRLLKAQTYQSMWTPSLLDSGRLISHIVDDRDIFNAADSYGLGWEVGDYKGYRVVYHSGFTGVSITKFPDLGLSVLVLANLTYPAIYSPNSLAKKIANFYLPYQDTISGDTVGSQVMSPNAVLDLLNQVRPNSDSFESSFYKQLLPALANYQRTMKHLGERKEITLVDIDKTNSIIIQTFKVNFSKGSIIYHVSWSGRNKISFISLDK